MTKCIGKFDHQNVFQDCLEKTCLEKKLTNKPTGKLDQ